jgi:cysteine desulfuration protein SufE
MNSISEKIASLEKDFAQYPEWEGRYKHLVQLGKSLPEMPEEMKVEKNKVRGCQSQVWLHVERSADGRMHIYGDSDALIVKGLVALVIQVYGDQLPSDILNQPPVFIKNLGFESHLSPSRTNGLMSMIKQIMLYATVLSRLP